MIQLWQGDCIERLERLEDESIGALVCDPPYFIDFMGKEWDSAGRFRDYRPRSDEGYGNKGILPHYGRGGTPQDVATFRRRANAEAGVTYRLWFGAAYRVLRPGGVAKVFGGTRVFHRLAAAMIEVGFTDIRLEAWGYGSGFPKSLNVSKALDRLAGVERPVLGVNPNHRPESGVHYEGVYAGGNTGAAEVTGPASEEAKLWAGWGTALKPAWEPVLVGRKEVSTA